MAARYSNRTYKHAIESFSVTKMHLVSRIDIISHQIIIL